MSEPKHNWADYVADLNELHQLCQKLWVSYEINFSEGDNRWYIKISSAAPAECYMSRSKGSLDHAIESAMEHLKKFDK